MTKLKNTYFSLRHGQSEANIAKIIVSHPDNGIPKYGLTDIGKEQVRKSLTLAKQHRILDNQTIIISSPL